MICSLISEVLGLTCYPLSDDGDVAMIDSPYKYPDGDELPIYVERTGHRIRFFDDGKALFHLLGRGVSFDDGRQLKFVKDIAEKYTLALNDQGELEIWSTEDQASDAFSNYISAMIALSKWEADQFCASATLE